MSRLIREASSSSQGQSQSSSALLQTDTWFGCERVNGGSKNKNDPLYGYINVIGWRHESGRAAGFNLGSDGVSHGSMEDRTISVHLPFDKGIIDLLTLLKNADKNGVKTHIALQRQAAGSKSSSATSEMTKDTYLSFKFGQTFISDVVVDRDNYNFPNFSSPLATVYFKANNHAVIIDPVANDASTEPTKFFNVAYHESNSLETWFQNHDPVPKLGNSI